MNRRQQGFTLIEVMVALLVFGLIATAASEVGSQYINTYERVRDKTLATWIAENRMAELRLAEAFPGIDETTRELEYGTYRWQVTTEIKATEEASIRRVDIHVGRFAGEGAEDPPPLHTLSGFIGEQGR
ncbi:MAG: type II secretion system minor pseudopilin GspI [Marinobacter sp.]|uniref:type II secretion system minor pseudopilin GspI n=1 Tax=Marinobacter sp. TaxID=50741 RepID=UPI00299CF7AE|nr:type II secretion system minor pseudopilin GspI [Marinobacter sp.]MDX1634564.1 type II secretion system minor pseudopilin GspI [Marinobacter sp.]